MTTQAQPARRGSEFYRFFELRRDGLGTAGEGAGEGCAAGWLGTAGVWAGVPLQAQLVGLAEVTGMLLSLISM